MSSPHPSLSPVFVDHSDLDTLTSAISINANQLPPKKQDQQFWATPARANTDPTIDVLEVDLTSIRLVNQLTFDAVLYPHVITVEYYSDGATWEPLMSADFGAQAVVSILQSVPAKLAKATSIPGHLHPQHAYQGHWSPITLRLVPTNLQRIRLRLQRSNAVAPPLDAFGQAVNYSLAIANLAIGFQVASIDDVPRTAAEPASFTTNQSFATTSDLLGSAVEYSLRVKRAGNILNNTDAPSTLIWQSEPQPFANAVVPFYADLRDENGDGQVIDKIFIDPVQTGAHISAYYSNDLLVGGFDGQATPLSSTQAQMMGTAALLPDRLSLGAYNINPVQTAYVDIDNSAVGFDPSLPWWIGMRVRPSFSRALLPSPRENLIPTPSFEQGIGTWSAAGTPTPSAFVASTDFAFTGTQSLKVTWRAGNTFFPDVSEAFATVVGQTYTLSGYAYVPAGMPRVQIYVVGGALGTPTTATGVWQRLTVTFTATSTSSAVGFTTPDTPTAGQIFYIDAVQAELGAVATPYFDGDSVNAEWEGAQGLSASRIDSDQHDLFDCGPVTLFLDGTGVNLAVEGNNLLTVPFEYAALGDLTLIASFDGTRSRIRITNGLADSETDAIVTSPIPSTPVSTLTLGASVTGTQIGDVDLYDLVVKEEVLPNDDFIAEPDAYSSVAAFASADLNTQNALLRLDPSNAIAQSGGAPSGLFGGYAQKYASMTWTPIPRDYIAQRGWMALPPTKAKYVKLEFTNLQAVYSEVYIPVTQTVLTFPPQVLAEWQESQSVAQRAQQDSDVGQATQAALMGNLPFLDFPTVQSTGGTGKGYTNTEAYVVDDYEAAGKFYAQRGVNWGYQDWHPGIAAPRFNSTQVHNYTKQSVQRTTSVGFQVGLRRLSFARTLYTGNDTVGSYDDALLDQLNIASSNWIFDVDSNSLYSGNAAQAVATSVVFGSSHNIKGVQFAAQQSPPAQLLPDPGFDDPNITNWALVGDALQVPNTSTIPLIGNVLQISRAAVLGLWEDISSLYPTWGDLVTAGVTYGQLVNTSRTKTTEGGVASVPQAQPAGGRLYAAARVVAEEDLSSPLWVQIVDSVTGAVLAEDSIVVKRDQVTEWFCDYTIGQGGARLQNRWGDLTGYYTGTLPSFSDTFARSNASTLGTMDSGQVWQKAGSVGQMQIVSAAAKVVSAGERSQVDVGSAWGTLTIQLGTYVSATGSAAVPLIDLGGYWVLTDGRVININTGSTIYTYPTLATNDILTFQFLPTKISASSADPIAFGWAVSYGRNGSHVGTLIGTNAFSQVKGLGGAVGQIFTKFAWAPGTTQQPETATNVYTLPVSVDGSYTTTTTTPGAQNVWTDSSGKRWFVGQHIGFTLQNPYLGNSVSYRNQTFAGAEYLDLDTGDQYGSLNIDIVGLASGVTTSTYNVLTLDQSTLGGTRNLFLRADGAVVDGSNSVKKAGVVPSITAFPTSVRYVNAAWLSPAFKTTWGVSSGDKQAMLFVQANSVVGVYSGTGIWTGTVRGAVAYGNTSNWASFVGFSWSSDVTQVLSNTGSVTWGDVDYSTTRTWGDMTGHNLTNTNPIEVRVVQKTASTDTWYMDDLSLFNDPILWEFSNSGGDVWCSAYEIRNNPKGVLMFPPVPTDANGQQPNNELAWRVTAFGPDCWVSHLVIRPWYVGFMRGVAVHSTASAHGPNLNAYDQYPPIDEDPRFRVWNSPIPRDWYFAYRSAHGIFTDTDPTKFVTLSPGDAYILGGS